LPVRKKEMTRLAENSQNGRRAGTNVTQKEEEKPLGVY